MSEQLQVEAPPKKKGGRPKGSKNKPKVPKVTAETVAPAVPGDEMRSAFAVPDSIYAEKSPSQTYAEVVETFFEKSGGGVGMMPDGTLLDVDAYVDRYDETGEPLDLDFRWGSWGDTYPVMNAQAGYVPVRRNPKTRKIDPNGTPVDISGGPSPRDKMSLLVRKGEISRMRAQERAQLFASRDRAARTGATEKIVEELGLKNQPKLVEHALKITSE